MLNNVDGIYARPAINDPFKNPMDEEYLSSPGLTEIGSRRVIQEPLPVVPANSIVPAEQIIPSNSIVPAQTIIPSGPIIPVVSDPRVTRAFKIGGVWRQRRRTMNDDEYLRNIIKIQNWYRSLYWRRKWFEERESYRKEQEELVRRVKDKMNENGIPPPDDDFSLTGWREFYPPDEEFFLWNKGITYPRSIRVKDPDPQYGLSVYEGDMNIKGQKHGFGRLTTPEGVMLGTWRNEQFTGWGRFSKRNGTVYEGKYTDGDLTGKGILRKGPHYIYKGEFRSGLRDGRGILATDNTKYDGEFRNDKKEGQGNLVYLREGHTYEGQFRGGEINGSGTFKWGNGDIYIGEMKNGKMHGHGKYYYKDSGQIYEGEYYQGKKQGAGRIKYPNQKELEGMFSGGKANGVLRYKKGSNIKDVQMEDGKIKSVIRESQLMSQIPE